MAVPRWAAAAAGVAGVTGLPVRALNLLTAVTAAVTVTVAMRVVGLLLVSALMVVPGPGP
ncbi:metal ABC transporter permease [Streptomyces sp. LaBMicrA B280]|uniref:metal ABC transporter permease n=1 Tax=Streptomyces sp. LaBMicrA B280 TaxID=3391001 RepID=UPI003BA69003